MHGILALWLAALTAGGSLVIRPIDTAAPGFPSADDYLRILERFPLYAERGFHAPYRDDATLGWFGDGRSDENGQRTMANFILAYAYLATSPGYDAAVSGVPQATVRDHALKALRTMLRTHVTGDLPCTDGRPWGNHWQSAWWTSKMVGGAKLLWDQLGEADMAMIEKVVTHEASRHIGLPPRVGEYGDTKSEENAWDSEVLSWAINLYPDHPNRAGWEEALARLALNTFSVQADLESNERVAGKPLREWLGDAPCIHSDFTIENHGFFHICYMICPLHSFAWCYYAYALHGKPAPEVIYRHTREVWERTKQFALWEDRFAYVGGKDWPRYAYGLYFILPALVHFQQVWDDGEARRIERLRVARFEQEQRIWRDGSFFSGRWTALRMERWPAEWETDAAANLTIAALLHRLGRPSVPTPDADFWAAREGVFVSPESELAMVRDRQRFASFCFKSNGGPLTGLVCSDQGEHQLEWNHSLGGLARLEGVERATRVAAHALRQWPGGFGAVGTVRHGRAPVAASPWRLVVRDDNVPVTEILKPEHPLFAGPEPVTSLVGLTDLDSVTEAGPGWTALARNRDGGPSILEATIGRGRFLISMTNFEERAVAGDPTGRALLANLLALTDARRKRCLYVRGEAFLRAALESAGVRFAEERNLARAELSDYDVIFVDRTCPAVQAHYPRLLAFVEAGGTVFESVVQDRDWSPDGIARAAPTAVTQDIAFCALPDGRTVVLHGRWRAEAQVTVADLDLLDWRLANDVFNGERRSLWHAGGVEVLTARPPARTVPLPGNWLNVDGDLGLAVVGDGLSLAVTDDPARRAPHGSLRFATVHLRPRRVGRFAQGDVIATYTVVFRTRQLAAETAALAEALRRRNLTRARDEVTLTVPGADGREYTLDLRFGDRPEARLRSEGQPHGPRTLPYDLPTLGAQLVPGARL